MGIVQLHQLVKAKFEVAVDFGVAKEITKDTHDAIVSGEIKPEDVSTEG